MPKSTPKKPSKKPTDAAAGTAPGLPQQAAQQPEPVNIRCKNPNCDSIQAIPFIMPEKPGVRLYRCVKCGSTKGVNLGGSVDF
jgi:hypothetical protein